MIVIACRLAATFYSRWPLFFSTVYVVKVFQVVALCFWGFCLSFIVFYIIFVHVKGLQSVLAKGS